MPEIPSFMKGIKYPSCNSEPEQIQEDEEEYNPYKAKIETLQFTCFSLVFMMLTILTIWFNA